MWVFAGLILVVAFGISAGLRAVLPLESHSAAFWILQSVYATASGIWTGARRAEDRWSEPGLLVIVLGLALGFLVLVLPALIGIAGGFGADIDSMLSMRASGGLIEGLEGVVPAVGSFYLVGCFIGWIAARFRRR